MKKDNTIEIKNSFFEIEGAMQTAWHPFSCQPIGFAA